MEITRETIIIPDEKQINIPIYNKKLNENEAHGLGIKDFSDKYNLGLTCQKLGLQENDYHDIKWFTETSKLGHLVIQKDENIIIYLPPVITEQQYRYLLEKKLEFYKYKNNVYAISIYYEDEKFYENGINNLMMEYEENKIEVLYQEIDKKYIPNKDSFILIVPDEEKLVIDNGIYFQEFDTNIGHAKMFQLFCMLHMIPIKLPEITGNPWAKELANNGFLVVKREKDEIYVFIPRNLSINQDRWLSENKEYLSTFQHLEAGIYLEDGSYKEKFPNENHPRYKTVLELVNEIYEEVDKKRKNMKRR